mgnify:FL=1
MDLIVAVARHARDEADPDRPVCPACGKPIVGRPYARVVEVNGARHPLWLCAPCWVLGEDTGGEGP